MKIEDLDSIKSADDKQQKRIDSLRNSFNELKDEINDTTKVTAIFNDKFKDIEETNFEGIIKGLGEVNRLLEKEFSYALRIKRTQDEINRLKKEETIEGEKSLRYWQKQREFAELNVKEQTKGLTLQEKINKYLEETGEKIGINTDKLKTGAKEFKEGLTKVYNTGKEILNVWGKVDQASANYMKAIGGSSAGMEKLRKTTIDFVETQKIGMKYNTSMEELIKLQQSYNLEIGRSINFTNSQNENLAAMKSVMGEELTNKFATSLVNFGINPDQVADMTGKMYSEAAKKGISFDKYSKNFLNNIKMAQNYTFANGVEGLRRMAEQASKLNFDMSQTAKLAEKVSTLEGALQTGAKLSVLGGSFAQYSNPLGLMNMGLNDVESLQDSLVSMIGGKAKWNSAKGQIDMDVFDRMQVKAAAEAMGIDYQQAIDSAFSIERRNIVQRQLTKFGGNSKEDQEMRELILNTAQLDKEGNAFVTINGKEKNINDVTENDRKELQIMHNSDSENIRDIAQQLRGWDDIIQGFGKQKDSVIAGIGEWFGFGDKVKGLISWFGESPIMKYATIAKVSLPAIVGLLTSIHGAIVMGRGVFGGNIGNIGSFASGSSTGSASATASTAASGVGKGTKLMGGVKRAGIGLGFSAVGMGINHLTNELSGEKKEGGYITGKVLGNALQWGGLGASVGSLFGPVGTAVGAAIGGVGGAIYGGISSGKESLRSKISYDHGIDLKGDYTLSELKEIYAYLSEGVRTNNSVLRSKLERNGDKTDFNSLQGFKNGGIIDGVGTSTSDSNVVAVSKGEAILPAATVNKIGISRTNDLINGKNIMGIRRVNENTRSPYSTKVELKPLKIDVSGTIKLDLGNQSVNIDPNVLLKNQAFVNELSKKLSSQINMAYNKEGSVNKFSQTTI